MLPYTVPLATHGCQALGEFSARGEQSVSSYPIRMNLNSHMHPMATVADSRNVILSWLL